MVAYIIPPFDSYIEAPSRNELYIRKQPIIPFRTAHMKELQDHRPKYVIVRA